MKLNDTEVGNNLTKIKQHLGDITLIQELEVVIKHLPTYTKIIKTHIEQLKNVLASNVHNNKDLDNINLSPIIKELINIFDKLQHDDLQLLENLRLAAINWQPEHKKIPVNNSNVVSEVTL